MPSQADRRHLYVFLDEGGNLDFSPTDSRYFTLTCVSGVRPFSWFEELSDLRYHPLESGLNLERFHATDDAWPVRNGVFDAIERHITSIRIDSLIVEKRKANPVFYPIQKFYPWALGELLRYVMNGRLWQGYTQVVVITDTLPLKKREKEIRKGIQLSVPSILPTGVSYQILHH